MADRPAWQEIVEAAEYERDFATREEVAAKRALGVALSAIRSHRNETEARLKLIAGGSIKKEQVNASDQALWNAARKIEDSQ